MKRRAEMNNLLKILLGGLPGMVHALWLVVSDKRG
ncbi:YqaE/Pmp3 family membrane protein [Aeromonas veronii]|nr:YqaE/Pmp3 family membrane protein [Aeromonas veronii]WFO52480.1 YqaE/Pmp3 family membrane protein [Aeromonas veronii]